MADRDDLIRERAYQIWLQRGQPEGSPDDHWFAAEQELADEIGKSHKGNEEPMPAVTVSDGTR